jgi:dolichol-phosphate mannosyltransferase
MHSDQTTGAVPPRAVVCLPTYNERDNLEPMLRALAEVLDTAQDRVLVIDDSSPDGTGELADRLAAELEWVDVLHRAEKEGLGPAYVAGFRRALADGAELVLEMDCDFSHDPSDVPRVIAAAAEADLVLGSRYVEGGGTGNWGLGRRIVSKGSRRHPRRRRSACRSSSWRSTTRGAVRSPSRWRARSGD